MNEQEKGLRWLAAAALGLAACSAGGESEGEAAPPAISMSFVGSADSAEEGGSPLEVYIRLQLSAGALQSPASVTVRDMGSGSAAPGEDYAAFEPVVVTFPAGSQSGDLQAVSLSALSDSLAEGPAETVMLGLVDAQGAELAGGTSFAVSVTDAQSATVSFSSGQQVTPNESDDWYPVIVNLSLSSGATLAGDVSVLVRNVTEGAEAGSDYAGFTDTVVDFPANSPNGASESLGVLVLNDVQPEETESVRLELVANSGVTVIGSIATHEILITDDDGPSLGSFVAQSGATGTENALAYDDSLALGTQTVDAGPNAGTRVRITNGGTSSMRLGTPQVSGANATDFDVEIEVFSMGGTPGLGELGTGASVETESPLVSMPADPRPGIAVILDQARSAELYGASSARLHGFPLPDLGQVTLDLQRLPLPVTEDAVLAVDGVAQPGGLAGALGEVSMWRGHALEIPGSRVFLALGASGPTGFLELPYLEGRIIHIMPETAESAETPGLCRVVHDQDLVAAGDGTPPALCGGERFLPGLAPGATPPTAGSGPPTSGLTVGNCRLAIETDFQFYSKFNSVEGTVDYVGGLIGAISDRYMTDVQTSLSIAYLGVHSNSSDPWTTPDSGSGDTGDMLDEFRAAWNASGWPVSADLAHFLSGANLGGGIAYVDVLCNSSYGYGVSANLNGNIDWSSWSGVPGSFTWDFVVVAHELGHNFGTGHTHSYCPPLDVCYANCDGTTSCSQGTIMSYCHACGGMDNIDLRFHHVTADRMRQSVESSCLNQTALDANDYVQYLVRFNPIGDLGARSATLEFDHNAPNETQPFRLQLSGTAE